MKHLIILSEKLFCISVEKLKNYFNKAKNEKQLSISHRLTLNCKASLETKLILCKSVKFLKTK